MVFACTTSTMRLVGTKRRSLLFFLVERLTRNRSYCLNDPTGPTSACISSNVPFVGGSTLSGPSSFSSASSATPSPSPSPSSPSSSSAYASHSAFPSSSSSSAHPSILPLTLEAAAAAPAAPSSLRRRRRRSRRRSSFRRRRRRRSRPVFSSVARASPKSTKLPQASILS
jgi:hypothetical protein